MPENAKATHIIGKTDLTDLVSQKLDKTTALRIPKKELGTVLDTLVDVITEEVEKDNAIRLIGFGTFKKKVTAPRKGRNPQTGEAMDIPEHRRLTFHSSVEF